MAFSLSGNIITQSGTDTNLSGLSSVAGVTTLVRGGKTIYNLGTITLTVAGTLSFNSNDEAIIWAANAAAPELTINAGSSLTISGERTTGTATFNTQDLGLIFARTGTTSFLPGESWVANNGTFTLNGAGVDANSVIAMSGTFIANDALLRNRTLRANFRYQSAAHQINGLRAENLNTTLINTAPAQLNGLSTFNGAFTFVTLPANTAPNPRVFSELGVTGIASTFTNFGGAPNFVEMNNFADWSGVQLGMNEDTNFSFRFTKDLQISYKSLVGDDIEDAVIFIPDNDNNNRPAFYPDDEPVIESTNNQGQATAKRLALIANITTNTGPEATPITPSLDFRNPANNDSGDDVMFVFAYSFVGLRVPVNLKGNGLLNIPVTGTEDVNVTLSELDARAKLSSSFIIDTVNKTVTVTQNSNYDDVYDALKAYKATADEVNLSQPSIGLGLIFEPNGNVLEAQNGYTIIVNDGVTLESGQKFTTIFADDITINGTGKITGLYQTNVGTSTIFTFGRTEAPIPAGCSLAIWDENGNTLFFEEDVAEGIYSFYIAPMAVEEPYFFAVERYGFRRFSGAFPSNAGEELTAAVSFIEDIGITETDLIVVQGYTLLANLNQVYDSIANFRLSEDAIKLGSIVERDGLFLDFNTRNVVFNDQASDVVVLDSGDLILRGLVIDSTDKYTSAKATPPATITAFDDEQLNFLIEDANGDSTLTLLGGDNIGYELWKVPVTTATDDFQTGELLITLPNNLEPFRFIGISGFDIVGRDISSGVRRRSSKAKGVYTQAFYVGNEIQLATDAPQLVENNTKLDSLTAELQSIKGAGWLSTQNTLKAISDRDEATQTKVEALGSPLQADDYVEPDNTKIAEIKTKVDTLENADLSAVALESTSQQILTAVDNIEVDNEAIADAVWDEVLTGSTHNIGSSAGRRLRTLADTVILKEGVGTNMANTGDTGLLTLEEGTTSQCIYQAIRVNDQVRFVRSYDSNTRVATMDKPWCEIITGNVEYVLFNLRESTEGIKVADIEASEVLAKEATLEEIKTEISNIEVDLSDVALESTLQAVDAKIDNIQPTDLNEVLEGIEKASILVPFKKS